MNSNLQKRLAALRAAVGAGSIVTLHMPDGSLHQIRGDNKHYFKLAALLDSEAEIPFDSELAWIRDAVRIDEPDHLYELLAALLSGPNLEGQEAECEPIR
jgi:hypothetical protein